MTQPEEDKAAPISFADLGLDAALLEALTALGYEEPTPVQSATIPALLAGKDVLGQAATGTGKTAAFALPILQRLAGRAEPHAPHALVLVPTRELAMQVTEAFERYSKTKPVYVLAVYGGQPIGNQIRMLRKGVDVVIATPGRALDHLERGTLKLDKVQTLVLDEADEMLDLGFAEAIEAILEQLPDEHQTALFSATLPKRISGIADKHLTDPVRVRLERELPEPGAMPKIEQTVYVVPRHGKDIALGRILDAEAPRCALVFCRTRLDVDRVTDNLTERGFDAVGLHGGMSQEQRDRVLRRFKGSDTAILVATDVAARGLDVEQLSHVVNYDVPSSPEVYVHRIGRTGRAGRTGTAVTLLEPRDLRIVATIERVTKGTVTVHQVPSKAAVRERQLARTLARIEARLAEENLDAYAQAIEALQSKYTSAELAWAAVAALHERVHGKEQDEEPELAQVYIPKVDQGPRVPPLPAPRGYERAPRDRPSATVIHHTTGQNMSPRDTHFPARPAQGLILPAHDAVGRAARAPAPLGAPRADKADFTRLFFSLGKNASLRPGDLVGAIANEASIDRSAIGAIDIFDRHSIVEVRNEYAEGVVVVMRTATLRGRPVKVDVDRGEGPVVHAPRQDGPPSRGPSSDHDDRPRPPPSRDARAEAPPRRIVGAKPAPMGGSKKPHRKGQNKAR
jgi:ATP-dependent RNA helicase DeaD